MAPRIIRAYIVDIGERVAPRAVVDAIQALKNIFAFGVWEEPLATGPTLSVPKPNSPERNYLPADVDALRDFAIVTLLFDSATCAFELTGLSTDTIH
ncbi:hypothetical protein BH23CHL2_BH23CHL2_23160 [soil metagenome]